MKSRPSKHMAVGFLSDEVILNTEIFSEKKIFPVDIYNSILENLIMTHCRKWSFKTREYTQLFFSEISSGMMSISLLNSKQICLLEFCQERNVDMLCFIVETWNIPLYAWFMNRKMRHPFPALLKLKNRNVDITTCVSTSVKMCCHCILFVIVAGILFE